VSDLVDGNRSPLRVAHRYLFDSDRLYRLGVIIAPIALGIAAVAGSIHLFWPSVSPLPPSARARRATCGPAPIASRYEAPGRNARLTGRQCRNVGHV
jgi:hypothetical protein